MFSLSDWELDTWWGKDFRITAHWAFLIEIMVRASPKHIKLIHLDIGYAKHSARTVYLDITLLGIMLELSIGERD
jgi:hypothetical protein